MKTCIIPGTRQEVIKMSPVVRACEGAGADWFVLHAGQGCSCDVGMSVLWGLGCRMRGAIQMLAKNDGDVRECIRYGGL